MTRQKKAGLITMGTGAVILLVGLLIIFNTESLWGPAILGVSILVNTIGLMIFTAGKKSRSRRK